MEKISRNFDLTSFKKSNAAMIATSDRAYESFLSRYNLIGRHSYTEEEINTIISSGTLESQIELSRKYFYENGFYQRIILFYATLLKYSGVLIPNPAPTKNLSNNKIQEQYYKAENFTEKANLKNLFTELTIKILRDGAYYGIVQINNKQSFALLDLPIKYCTSRFKDENGNDIIEFDVSYFNSIKDEEKRQQALSNYPKNIVSHYNKWRKNKIQTSQIILPTDTSVCFPFFESRPFFLSTIPATIQYDKAVETEQKRAKDEIKKIIVQKIPHLNDGGLLFEPEEAVEIHNGTVGMMKSNENVSILTTYADVDSISSSLNDSVSENFERMVKNIYNGAGVSSELFATSSSSSLETSIKNDIALMMILANKYSNFITNLINNQFSNTSVNFKYTILPISYYNDSSYIIDSFKLAQSGYSFILPALALGLTQRDLTNIKDLENNVLVLSEKLKPLASAYTTSSSNEKDNNDEIKTDIQTNDEGGRPTLKESEKAPETLRKEESLDKNGGL